MAEYWALRKHEKYSASDRGRFGNRDDQGAEFWRTNAVYYESISKSCSNLATLNDEYRLFYKN